jgi:Galactose oxidase, central domain
MVWTRRAGLILVVVAVTRCSAPAVQGDAGSQDSGSPDAGQLTPAMLVATPSMLTLLPTSAGRATSGSVTISNHGQAAVKAAVTVDAPFAVTPGSVELGGGSSVDVTVTLTPTAPGLASGVLHVGALDVPVSANTIQGSPCHVVTCDPATGCTAPVAPDGTLCGVDDCTAMTAQVCQAGACVTTPRPGASRCVSRWLPKSIRARTNAAIAFDATRQRTVLFGGTTRDDRDNTQIIGDTWEWDGTSWLYRAPLNAPSPRYDAAMAWDPIRQRMVLFGGGGGDGTTFAFGDTWEWDGTNWVKRNPATTPPARLGHAMVWDPVRRRVVMLAGISNLGPYLGDTWEWDGTNWEQRTPATSLPATGTYVAAWDEARQRIVAFHSFYKNFTMPQTETWEWDGLNWTLTPSTGVPEHASNSLLAWDGRHLLLFGDLDFSGAQLWLREGTNWVRQSTAALPPGRRAAAMSWDSARGRVVLFSGDSAGFKAQADTWEWDGTAWSLRSTTPGRGRGVSCVWDDVRLRVLLFSQAGTWEWDGSGWTQRQPSRTSIDPGSMVWDSIRHRAVLFTSETWEWDGTDWTQQSPAQSPPARYGTTMAWDPDRQRTVLFGGGLWRSVLGRHLGMGRHDLDAAHTVAGPSRSHRPRDDLGSHQPQRVALRLPSGANSRR